MQKSSIPVVFTATGNAAQPAHLVQPRLSITVPDLNGDTPLHRAVARIPQHPMGQFLLVRKLIQYGAPVDAQNKAGNTPLHIAAQQNNLEIVRMLLHAGADRSVINKDGFTPYGLAEYHESFLTRRCLSPKGSVLAKL